MSDYTDDVSIYEMLCEDRFEEDNASFFDDIPVGWWKVSDSYNEQFSSDENNMIKISKMKTKHIENVISFILKRTKDKYNSKLYELELELRLRKLEKKEEEL